MKNIRNNGFTLVELLAVIIILSLLALIASTAVTKLVKDTKGELSDTQMTLIKSAAESWGAENLTLLPNAGECKYLTLEDLKESGLMDSKVVDPKTNEELSDELKIKITGTLNKHDKLVINYEVNPESIEGCNTVYIPKLNPQGTYLMLTSSVSSADTTFLGGTIKRSQVESVSVTYTNKVPDNVVGSWDASALKDASVMVWYTDKDSNGLYELYIGGEGGVKANPNSSNLFAYFTNATTFDVNYLDTSEVTNMYNMFSNCIKMNSIDVGKFDTSVVTNLINMFSNCQALTSINLSNFITDKVTSIESMFYNCSNLEIIDLRKADFSHLTSTHAMVFYNCNKLVTIYVKDSTAQSWINSKKSGVAVIA